MRMKKILYISNIAVPYKIKFFNMLADYCDLTVLYEREKSSNRDISWMKHEKLKFKIKYLNGLNYGKEYSFSIRVLKYIFSGQYDEIIISCYNSATQILASSVLKILNKKFWISADGELYFSEDSFKSRIKRKIFCGAYGYLSAGEEASKSIKKVIGNSYVATYYFSSLDNYDLQSNSMLQRHDDGFVLVIGQYYDYKGMDVALRAAAMNESIKYKFVGMGKRADIFASENTITRNVEIIPFLQKENLEREYLNCSMVVLPTRRECWGLIVNEAASFGTPIVSTYGSGAAVEFLKGKYTKYLALPDDPRDLYKKICTLYSDDNIDEYSEYLKNKSAQYSIEQMVNVHRNLLEL